MDQTLLRREDQIPAGRKIGRFEVGSLIAVGRTSRVLHGVDQRTRKQVALKIFHGELAVDRKLVAKLSVAAKAQSKLDRARFVPVVDADLTPDGVAFVA